MKQYLISVWHDEEYSVEFTPEQMETVGKAVSAFNERLQGADALVFAGGLHPASSATTVRPNGDEVLLTDGPYAETKEQIGGFWVVKAADLDAALELGKQGALACGGPVEVRPFQEEG